MGTAIIRIQELFGGNWENRAALATAAFAGLLLIIVLVNQIVTDVQAVRGLNTAIQAQKPGVQAELTSKAPNQYLKYPIFGRSNQVIEKVNTKHALLGILFASENAQSKAVIAEPGAKQQLYAVGDRLSDGFRIEKISTDKVILAGNEENETLYVDWKVSNKDPKAIAIREREFASRTKTPEADENFESEAGGRHPAIGRYIQKIKELRKAGRIRMMSLDHRPEIVGS